MGFVADRKTTGNAMDVGLLAEKVGGRRSSVPFGQDDVQKTRSREVWRCVYVGLELFSCFV